MSARQSAALLKSSRQDGWTNNNNNRNAHQVHNNNNVINTTMYPEQQLSAGSIGQNVQPAQFTNNININVNTNMNATNSATNNNPQQQNIKSADNNYSSTIPLMVPSTADVDSYPSGLMQQLSLGGDGYQSQQNNMIPTIPHQFNMQPYCNYDNAYEIAQRPQKQLKCEQYSGVVSGDNNELYQNLSNKFGHTIMDKSTTTPEINNWLQSKDWRKMVSLHQAVSSESETITNSQQQYLLRSKTRNYEYIYKTIDGTYSQRKYEMTTDRDRDIVEYKTIDLIHLLKWQELNLEEKIDSITTITSPTTFKNKNTKSTNPRNLYKIVDPSTGRIVDDNTCSIGKGRTTTFAKVPRNVRPGEDFQALVDDQVVRVRCPLDPKQILYNEETRSRSIEITVPVDTEKALEVVEQKRKEIQWMTNSLPKKKNKELSDKVATLEADNKDKLRQLGKLDTDDQPILKQIKELEEICLRAHFISVQTSKMSILNKIQELRYGYDSTDEDLILLTDAYNKDQEIVNAQKSVFLDNMYSERVKVQVSAYTSKEQASMRSKNAIINVYIDRLQYYRLLLVRHLRRCHEVLLEKKSRGEKFLDSERYVQMHQLKQECITRGFVQYASPREEVGFSIANPDGVYMNVPLNLYVGECEREWKAIMSRLQELLDNGNRYEKRVGQYITKL